MATVCDHLSVEELEERYVGCQDATASRHFQVIWLLRAATPFRKFRQRQHLASDGSNNCLPVTTRRELSLSAICAAATVHRQQS